MKNTVVVGAQFGDEGKAKITDILASQADLIVRFQGGCNAGHTVVADGVKYKFHVIPSGILYEGKTCFVGAGVVLYPKSFKAELEDMIANGLSREKIEKSLKISPLAHITMPYHIDLDGIQEEKFGKNKIGTTKKGIGPTYTDKYARQGIRIEDLFDEELLSKKVDIILERKNLELKNLWGLKTYTKEEIMAELASYKELFEPFVCHNWQELLLDFKKNKTILFEGAQGVLLDVDYGTYPYVTSSNPIAGGAGIGAGVGPLAIEEAIGIFKAYITRVGEGPFVTELTDEIGENIRIIGGEFGTTTGRPRRCGWFDGVIARYSALVGGLSTVALTKLDVFDSFEEIKVCTAYKNKKTGEITKYYPTNVQTHGDYEPVYKTYKGWLTDTTKCKSFDELPTLAKEYIAELENIIGLPISIVSVGPDRCQTFFR
ncbi:adenylosuccinate synthase [bacterium]|nr:adenylosuccinate synthase [bacterium]